MTLKNGKQTCFHHSFEFNSDTHRNFTDQQRRQLHKEREAAKGKSDNNRPSDEDQTVLQLESKIETMSRTMETLVSQVQSGALVPSHIHMSQGSQSHTPPSHVGGLNEQIQRRNTGGKTH